MKKQYRKIFLVAIIVCLSFVVGCSCKKEEFTKCSSSQLDMSGGNFTINITSSDAYVGTYYVTENFIKKTTSSATFFYTVKDGISYRYYKSVDGFKYTDDDNKILNDLDTIKTFFTAVKNLYTNSDKTIFKTKSGDEIYDINSTNIEITKVPLLENCIVNDLHSYTTYKISPSAISVKTSSSYVMYIKRTSGVSKYNFNGNTWEKVESTTNSLDDVVDEIYDKFEDAVLFNNEYLTLNGISIKNTDRSLYASRPTIGTRSYTLVDPTDGITYRVTKNAILIATGTTIKTYAKEDDKIYEYYYDNTNQYVLKRLYTEPFDFDNYMQDKLAGYCYSNEDYTSFILIGDKEYVLSNIDQTYVFAQATAELVSNASSVLGGHSFVLKDNQYNINYCFNGNKIAIENVNLSSNEILSDEGGVIYRYYLENEVWHKERTEQTEIFNYQNLYNEIDKYQIIKVNDYTDIDFVAEYRFTITMYDNENIIDLPVDYIED